MLSMSAFAPMDSSNKRDWQAVFSPVISLKQQQSVITLGTAFSDSG